MNETEQIIPFKKLAAEFLLYLRQINYPKARIDFYQRGINQISEFIKQWQPSIYLPDIANKYIYVLLNGRKYDSIKRLEKDYIRVTTALLQYQTIGAITFALGIALVLIGIILIIRIRIGFLIPVLIGYALCYLGWIGSRTAIILFGHICIII
jgi:hypothetical protein